MTLSSSVKPQVVRVPLCLLLSN